MSSTYSQNNGGECIEWSPATAGTIGVVPVRDSKNPSGPVLMFSREGWAGLIQLALNTDV
ncbi:DUF397 domain-containing protein [Streptomyces sp. H27-D2]|uniref:DUF397 domain-containing protein n=1 Tax=Streptomyces sp. H27-D2 TaxID=3046304 RepID=UPI002DBF8074|nr:DUF397 domain-containing protein [Streptomyces sp. H27-D2]MEC4019360.1 DUF397 domain-containing protein [Streptomyces sp. H27-D2]